jgi:hypothetical protein
VHDALLTALIDQAHAEGADGVHLPVLPVDDVALVRAATRSGFRVGEGLPWALVPLDEPRLGPWPSSLRSGYRRTLQRNRRVVAAIGVCVSTAREDLDARRLHELYSEVADKKEGEEEQYSALRYRHPTGFFAHVLSDPAFHIVTLRDPDGVVCAYNVGVKTGHTFQSVVVGLDRAAIARRGAPDAVIAVYQVLHAEVVTHAEAAGCRWVVLGTTALDGKARLGAVFRRMREADLPLSRAYAAFLDAWPVSNAPAPLPPCRPWTVTAASVVDARARRFVALAGPSE